PASSGPSASRPRRRISSGSAAPCRRRASATTSGERAEPRAASCAKPSRSVPAEISSLTGEVRFALLEERGDAFAVVRALADFALQIALQVELRGQVVVRGAVHGFLDQAERAGRTGGEMLGKFRRFRHQLVVI